MRTYKIVSLIILVLAVLLASFLIRSEKDPESKYHTRYGLDLSGGTHLVYEADVTTLEKEDVPEAMQSLKNVIERRVNIFGVSEPLVQVERSGVTDAERLIVELPGVTDIDKAVETIGKTPVLEFKLVDASAVTATTTSTSSLGFIDTGLTGRLLKRAQLTFAQAQSGGNQFAGTPLIEIEFNEEGAILFETITRENAGENLAIFLDGAMLSAPEILGEIKGGRAQITGVNDPEEARSLVRDLNLGALPVPIKLVSTQSIGPSLGEEARDAGLKAGIIGFGLVGLFLILWYRVPGLIATLALSIYILLMIALFKLIPVVLTSAGIAGFILSLGMAVDANILVFERMKEEFSRHGGDIHESMKAGFARAWNSIRDGNTSAIISAVILYMAGTPLTKGFAVTLGIGVIVSIFSALFISRMFLYATAPDKLSGNAKFLYGSGLKK